MIARELKAWLGELTNHQTCLRHYHIQRGTPVRIDTREVANPFVDVALA